MRGRPLGTANRVSLSGGVPLSLLGIRGTPSARNAAGRHSTTRELTAGAFCGGRRWELCGHSGG